MPMKKVIPLMQLGILGIYTLLIAYVSLANDSSPDAAVPDLNSFEIPNLDKVAHTAAYALFVVLSVMVFGTRRLKYIVTILLSYGLILELLQSWVPAREPSFADFGANAIGVMTGLIFILWLAKRPKNQLSTKLLP